MNAMTNLLDGYDLFKADHRRRVARVRRWLWIKAWREIRKGNIWSACLALWLSILIIEFLKWINL